MGNQDNIEVLKKFYSEFEPLVNNAFKSMEKTKAKETGETCPNWGSDMVTRKGRYGEFLGCAGYPECDFIKRGR